MYLINSPWPEKQLAFWFHIHARHTLPSALLFRRLPPRVEGLSCRHSQATASPGMFIWLPAGGQRAAAACLVTQFAEAALKETRKGKIPGNSCYIPGSPVC